jgi:hypothetical protein
MKKDYSTLKEILFWAMLIFILITPMICENIFYNKDGKYDEGPHKHYSIECVNGFKVKMENRTSTQILNTDGTPSRCGTKTY